MISLVSSHYHTILIVLEKVSGEKKLMENRIYKFKAFDIFYGFRTEINARIFNRGCLFMSFKKCFFWGGEEGERGVSSIKHS